MAVSANLELLRRRIPGDPAVTKLIDGALAGAERGKILTNRMLAFARRQELKPVAVQLRALIENMEELLRRSVGPMVRIRTAIDPRLPDVRVDPHQLELALLNLALNARDAMPDGGEVSIAADRATGGRPARALADGEFVTILVSDTGSGMDEATLARAVEPFFTTKGVGKGTGLGLSMVQGVVTQSGGTMQIESGLGQGTQVRLWLPVDNSKVEVAPIQTEDAAARESQAIQVVLVDDDPLILATTAAMLEDLGHVVITAPSGTEALEVLEGVASKVHVVITDYAMPGLNGLQLARLVKMQWPWLSVILASGYAEKIDHTESSIERLVKPYSLGDMTDCIGRVMSARKVVSIQSVRRA
jgi:CheY-like chemotaxis protein/two-component sensor histidine kinase